MILLIVMIIWWLIRRVEYDVDLVVILFVINYFVVFLVIVGVAVVECHHLYVGICHRCVGYPKTLTHEN